MKLEGKKSQNIRCIGDNFQIFLQIFDVLTTLKSWDENLSFEEMGLILFCFQLDFSNWKKIATTNMHIKSYNKWVLQALSLIGFFYFFFFVNVLILFFFHYKSLKKKKKVHVRLIITIIVIY